MAEKTIMTPLIAVIAAIVLILLWVLVAYNSLIRSRNKVDEALSGIDVQLHLRHDLVPQLVKTVAGYAQHEASLLQRVAGIRDEAAKAQSPAMAQLLENQLASGLGSLTALAERYPNLLASENYRELASSLIEVEDEVQAASAIYNSNAQFYNSRMQSIPTAWIADALKFTEAPYVRLDVAEVRSMRAVA